MATVTPPRVESTLLVVAAFKDRSGTEWREGDRASLAHRSVRIAAREQPDLFRMEYATVPVDQEWLAELDRRYDADYERAKKARDEQAKQRERDLRAELKAQDDPQPELERRFKQQEKERAEREKAVREELERQGVEADLAVGHLRHGYHVTDY